MEYSYIAYESNLWHKQMEAELLAQEWESSIMFKAECWFLSL